MEDLIRGMVAQTGKLTEGLSATYGDSLLKEAPEEEPMQPIDAEAEEGEQGDGPAEPQGEDAEPEAPVGMEPDEFEKQYLGSKGDDKFYIDRLAGEDENEQVLLVTNAEGDEVWSSKDTGLDVVDGDMGEIIRQVILEVTLDQISYDLVMRYDLLSLEEDEEEEEDEDELPGEEDAVEPEVAAVAPGKEPEVV